MCDLESNDVERTLAGSDIHKLWVNSFRTPDNENFFTQAFNYINICLDAPNNSTFLDAGCGTCAHSIRLANYGFNVIGIDVSESALKMAESNIKSIGLDNKIKLQKENILSLSFPDNSFDYILCWGVLMHIPNVNKAISEFDRVLKPGGIIVVSELNMFSLQSIIQRNLIPLFRKKKAVTKKTPAGIEYWITIPVGVLLIRQANIKWLKEVFNRRGFIVKQHLPGQFTELYTIISSPFLRSIIHKFNNWWFKYIKIARFAVGNILILKKVNIKN